MSIQVQRAVGSAVLVAMSIITSGCSSLNPVPVNAANNNLNAAGLRFYETRPFIVVHKPFPIGADILLVDAKVSPDGQQVRFLKPLPPEFANYIQTLGPNGSLPAASVASSAPAPGGHPQAEGAPLLQSVPGVSSLEKDTQSLISPIAGDANKLTSGVLGTVDKVAQHATDLAKVGKQQGQGSKPGVTSVSQQVDATGTATVPVNDLFSIVFLPDYSREYVVDTSSSWFSSKQVHLTTGPGGGLIALNAEFDNSALVGPLMKAYSTLVAAGGLAAVAAINPAGGALSVVGKVLGEGKGFQQNRTLSKGSVVTLRLTKIRYAVPGIYPLSKPNETFHGSKQSGFNVETPTDQYQVPYRYYETLVAESVSAPPPAALVPGAQPGTDSSAQAQPNVNDAVAACHNQNKVATTEVASPAAIQKFLDKVGGMPGKITGHPLASSPDGAGCLNSLTLQLSFPPAAGTSGPASFLSEFKNSYGKTDLTLK